MNKRNTSLLMDHGAKKVAFRDLPPQHRKALIWYMAVDGTAWKSLGKISSTHRLSPDRVAASRVIDRATLASYTSRYGKTMFRVASIPSGVLKAAAHMDIGREGFLGSYEDHHRWYIRVNLGGRSRPHSTRRRWPCIMSNVRDELFQDGWHRWHTYIDQGARKIPVVAFA
jgi:hypothetical protein